MENHDIIIKGKGIKVSVLSAVFIAVGLIVMAVSFMTINRIYTKYDEMMGSYQAAEAEKAAAAGFSAASDYLTDQARQFAVTGDIKNAENYFEEKDVIKRREAAIASIGTFSGLDLEKNLLNEAMEQSEALVEYELHAMKLTAAVNNIPDDRLPAEVAAFELTGEELALTGKEQHERAVQLLYNEEYESYKDRINWEVDNAIVLITDEAGAHYMEEEADLIFVLNITTFLVFVMFILLMLIFIFNSLLVVRPARKFTDSLDKKEKLPVIGGYEFRKFARKYNDVYRSDKKRLELLKEQGEIDSLTGTLKAGTLEIVRHNLTQENLPLGIVMADIDNFRSIKESNGYEMADRVVKKTADLFVSCFKTSDYIIRTSQDEFELYLPKIGVQDSEMLIERINKINQKLKDDSDGVISSSVSVGIAFSENGYTVEAERRADMALNNVKENGRGSCKINAG